LIDREDEAARRVRDLEREKRDLIDAVRARDDFIAIAAHELRNPMTPIYALVDRLLEDCQRDPGCPAPLLQGLELLKASVDRFVARATSLLDVSRVSAGADLSPTPFDFVSLTMQAVARHRRAADRVGAPLRFEHPTSLPGRWDAVAIEQIIDNLLSNAVKYGAGSPITVALDGDHRHIRLEVVDRGIGISPCDQARIFGKFEQVVHTRERSGLGIGLWVTRQLVEAMNGTIAVTAKPGEGSSFVVTLPTNNSEVEEGAT
jgi:two-component system, OmpR family, sensor kinase